MRPSPTSTFRELDWKTLIFSERAVPISPSARPQDTYLPPWEAAITQGGALGVMCSYNGLNGVPSCANRALQVGAGRGR